MEKNYEVELRRPLTSTDYERVSDFLLKNGELIANLHRFLIDYSTFLEGIGTRKRDIRVRITNGQPELVVKMGEWGGTHRKEVSVLLKDSQFENAIQFLGLLGYIKGVACERIIKCYKYKGINLSLVEVPGYSYFFEAEKMGIETEVNLISQEMLDVIHQLGLKVFTKEEFYAYIEDLNKNVNWVFDFRKYQPGEFAKIEEQYKRQ